MTVDRFQPARSSQSPYTKLNRTSCVDTNANSGLRGPMRHVIGSNFAFSLNGINPGPIRPMLAATHEARPQRRRVNAAQIGLWVPVTMARTCRRSNYCRYVDDSSNASSGVPCDNHLPVHGNVLRSGVTGCCFPDRNVYFRTPDLTVHLPANRVLSPTLCRWHSITNLMTELPSVLLLARSTISKLSRYMCQ